MELVAFSVFLMAVPNVLADPLPTSNSFFSRLANKSLVAGCCFERFALPARPPARFALFACASQMDSSHWWPRLEFQGMNTMCYLKKIFCDRAGGLCKGCARGCARGCAGSCARNLLDKGL